MEFRKGLHGAIVARALVSASSAAAQANALDGEVGMCVEELGQHALHLHAWRVAVQLDALGLAATDEVEQLPLEFGVRGGGVQIRKEIRHRRLGESGESLNMLHMFSEANPLGLQIFRKGP